MHPTRQVLATPAVRLYLASRFFSRFARALVAAMLSYHVYVVTGSYAALGLLGLVEFLPVIPVSLLAGALADRFDRRRVIILSYAAAAAAALVLAAQTHGAEGDAIWIFSIAFVLAISSGFAAPSASALLPSLVPIEIFQNATVVNASFTHGAWVAGPIAMGFLIEPLGFGAPYALAALFYLASIACMAALRAPPLLGERSEISCDAVREGISFVWRAKPILGSMSLDMFAVIFASATALLPVYAEEILHVGPVGYGVLRASMGIGTLTMALALLVVRPFERPGRVLLQVVVVFGLATLVFGLSRSFPVSVAAFVVAGMADQVSMTVRSVILQMSTPDSLRGRVSAVSMIFIGASNELGEVESGFLASLTSATFSVVAGAIACLGITGIVAVRLPELRAWRPPAA